VSQRQAGPTCPPASPNCSPHTLTRLVDRGRIEECPWCDTLGLVDGDDGPEFCGHPPPLDNG
jgi:hypothetical protein